MIGYLSLGKFIFRLYTILLLYPNFSTKLSFDWQIGKNTLSLLEFCSALDIDGFLLE